MRCCHWNVNKKTYVDFTVAADDKDLVIEGYNLVCADHPSNPKKGGICIYYKESLTVHLINVNYLSECLLWEVTFDNKKGYIFAVLYR